MEKRKADRQPLTRLWGKLLRAAGLALVGLSLVCLPAVAPAAQTIKIGVLEPLSGPLATIGQYELDSYRLAVEDINAAGGIKSMGGAKLELVLADTECKAEVGMSQVEKLDREKVAVIMGAFQSGVTIPTTQVAEMKGIPYVVPISVADVITQRGFKYTFRACSSSYQAIERQAEFVYKYVSGLSPKPIKTVGLLYENSAFGQTNAKYQKEMAAKYGVQIVADIAYPSKSSDLSAEIAKLKAADPDVVLRTSYASDAIVITKTMIELRYNPKFWIGFSGVSDNSYIKALGKYVEGTIFMDPFSPKVAGAADVMARFEKKYNKPMASFSRSVYPVVWVVADALERAGSADRKKLRDALAKTNIPPGERGNIMPYTMSFDETGQNVNAQYNADQYQNGGWKVVWPEKWGEAKLLYPIPKWEDR